MENPQVWNEVEKKIHEAIVEADLAFVNNVIGGSYVHYVYRALKEGGYLKDEY